MFVGKIDLGSKSHSSPLNPPYSKCPGCYPLEVYFSHGVALDDSNIPMYPYRDIGVDYVITDLQANASCSPSVAPSTDTSNAKMHLLQKKDQYKLLWPWKDTT